MKPISSICDSTVQADFIREAAAMAKRFGKRPQSGIEAVLLYGEITLEDVSPKRAARTADSWMKQAPLGK